MKDEFNNDSFSKAEIQIAENEMLADKIAKWKQKQPEFIAVEMTNKEICLLLNFYTGKPYPELIFIIEDVIDEKGIRLINGKLYKKVLNPKIYKEKVIAFNTNKLNKPN